MGTSKIAVIVGHAGPQTTLASQPGAVPFALEVNTNVKHPVVLVFDAASVGKIINPVKFPNSGAAVESPS